MVGYSTRHVPALRNGVQGTAKRKLGAIGGKVALIALATTALIGCSMRPQPITQAEHFQRAEADYKALYQSYVPMSGPLTLSEAIARALKYNYDAELAKTEVTLQEKQLDLAMVQMLPRLAATGGYDWRNNDDAAESVDERTKLQSLDYSYSEAPGHGTAGLELSWNILDLGVSYFQAKQQGYRAYVAVERRRKVINSIVKGVQEAYWNAVAADRLLPRLDPLLAEAQHILDESRESSRDKLQPALQALDFQNDMLQIIGQLEHMQTDLNTAKVQLASLINVPIDTPVDFASMQIAVPPMRNEVDPRRLETLGLVLRPELREEAYQEKIDLQDVNKEIVKMLPGFNFLSSVNFDSNQYLWNSTWGDFGVQATYNLVNLIEGPKAISAARTTVEVSRIRRLALSVAVLTQVNLGYQEYVSAQRDLSIAQQIDDVQRQIAIASRNEEASHSQSEAEHVRRELSSMASEFAFDRSVAQVHTALANLYTSTGVDLVPPSVDTDDLKTLTAKVQTAIAGWEAGDLPDADLPASWQKQVLASTGPAYPAPAQPKQTSDAQPLTVARVETAGTDK
jgi:outer membrane protein TolC